VRWLLRGAWLALVSLAAAAERGAAQEPQLATLVQPLAFSWEACRARASSALKEQGYSGFLESGNGWTAHARGTSASLVCVPQSGRTVLVIVTAGAQFVKESRRLFEAIRGPESPPKASHDSTPRDASSDAAGSGWSATATTLAGHTGARFNFWCPPQGVPAKVWGDSVYAGESSVCTAAVHAGTLSLRAGGNAIIEILPGQPFYGSSTRNGIATLGGGPAQASFLVVKREP
jgi:hypothetical protein